MLLTLAVLTPCFAQKASAPGALATAAAAGDMNAVEDILGKGGRPDQPDSLGQTPLMYAVLSGDYRLVERLLNTTADPNHPGRDNLTPLIAAVRAAREDLVLLLLSNGADPNSITDISGVPTSALSEAVNRGEIAIARRLVLLGAKSGFLSDSERTNPDPLRLPTVNVPLDSRIWRDMAHLDDLSDPPDWDAVASAGGSEWNLHQAARDDDWFVVRDILDAGVNPDRPDSRGVTPLMSAARFANDAVVSLLLQRGADAARRDDEGHSVLAYAALGGDVRILSDLLTAVDGEEGINVGPSEVNLKTTPLYYALISGNHTALDLLIDAGYPTNAVDDEGINALMMAAWLGDFYAVSKLLPVTDGVWGDNPKSASLDDAGRSALDWSLAAFKRDRRSGRDIGITVKAQQLYPMIRALAYRTRNPDAAATQPTQDVHETVRKAWSMGRNPTIAADWSMMVPSPVPDVPGDGDLVVYRILRDEEPGIPTDEVSNELYEND